MKNEVSFIFASLISLRAYSFLIALVLVTIESFGQTYLRQPGGGFGSLRVGKNCQLGQLLTPVEDGWANRLAFRVMDADRNWSDLTTVYEFSGGGSPEQVSKDAALFHRTIDGSLYWEAVFLADNSQLKIYRLEAGSHWSLVAEYSITVSDSGSASMAVCDDEAGGYHILWLLHGSSPNLRYLHFNGQEWIEESVGVFNGATEMEAFDAPHNLAPPRSLNMLLDTAANIHAVFSVQQTKQPVSGGTRVRSDLFYLSRHEDRWSQPEIVLSGGSSDDAGLGASLALAPDGTVALAATYLPRTVTGSPGRASLRYLRLTEAEGWKSEMVADSAAGYFSRDGQRGTGLYPDLSFDREGRPVIVFNDHASEHTQGTAFSYAGQVRLATRPNPHGGPWTLETLVAQPTSDAFLRRASPPVLATGGSTCQNITAFFAAYADFDEPIFTWNHFEFSNVEGNLSPVLVWYAGASELANGWRYYDWFKGFKPLGNNWIYHGRHGWLFYVGESTTGLFFWDTAMRRWLWTNRNVYPWMYAYGPNEGWLFFFQGGRPGSRFFQRGDTGQVVPEADLRVP